MKTKPTPTPGGLEEISLGPYPHGGEHMQQHATPALEVNTQLE